MCGNDAITFTDLSLNNLATRSSSLRKLNTVTVYIWILGQTYGYPPVNSSREDMLDSHVTLTQSSIGALCFFLIQIPFQGATDGFSFY